MKKLTILLLAALLLSLCACAEGGAANTAPPVITPATASTTASTTEPVTTPTTVPVETEPEETLQLGYYILEKMKMSGITLTGPALETMKGYIRIAPGGEGELCMMDAATSITWNDTALNMDGVPEPYFLENGVLIMGEEETGKMFFAFCGETLPEGFVELPPAGYYAVSSVGKDGDISFYYDIKPENGWLELYEDGTGVLCFGGKTMPFVLDGMLLRGEELAICYNYIGSKNEGEQMLALYLYNEKADSIILRPVEKPEA